MEFLSIIRLSVQCWYCVKTIVFIVKLFTPSARALQFFLLEIPTVIPSLRALNTANEKNRGFHRNRRLFRKWYGVDSYFTTDY